MTLLALYVLSVAFYNFLLVPGVVVTRPPWTLGGLLIAWSIACSLRRGAVPRPGLFGLMLAFFGLTTVVNGVLVYLNPNASLVDYSRTEFQFLLVFGVVFAFTRARLSEAHVAKLLHVWVWTAAAASVFGIYQSFARVLDLPLAVLPVQAKGFEGMVVKEFFGFYAISAWFAEPSWFGSFLLVPLLYLFGVVLHDVPKPIGFNRRVSGTLTVLLTLSLMLSLSQAAYATVLVLSLPLIWSLPRHLRFRRVVTIVAAAVVVFLGTAILLGRSGGDVVRAQRSRFAAILEAWRTPEVASQITSYAMRMQNMRGGIEMWRSSPIVGLGINNARHHPHAALLLTDSESGSVDSGLLQVLVDQGLLGFGALTMMIVVLWTRLRRAAAVELDARRGFILWFLMWGLATDLANSMLTHPWQHPQRWLVIALAASFVSFLSTQPADSTSRNRPVVGSP